MEKAYKELIKDLKQLIRKVNDKNKQNEKELNETKQWKKERIDAKIFPGATANRLKHHIQPSIPKTQICDLLWQ